MSLTTYPFVQHFDKGRVLHNGQVSFRVKWSDIDNIYILSELVQGRMKEGRREFPFSRCSCLA